MEQRGFDNFVVCYVAAWMHVALFKDVEGESARYHPQQQNQQYLSQGQFDETVRTIFCL